MNQSRFEALHDDTWRTFQHRLERMERRKAKATDGEHFSREYSTLCQHLALARDRSYSGPLVERLQHLAMRGHQQLYSGPSQYLPHVAAFLLAGFPRRVRQEAGFVILAACILFGSLALAATLCLAYPGLLDYLMGPEQLRAIEAMYDPDRSRLGAAAERLSSEDWAMFGYYVMNNVGIAFQTFASGMLLGLGSLFYLAFNGLNIGAIAGHLTTIGYTQTFWPFVVGHSAFELTGIALAGAAGLKLGWAILAPGRHTRAEALRLAGAASIQLVYGVMVFLLLAAFIEAYWSSRTDLPVWLKYAVGAALWMLVCSYLLMAGRGENATER